MSEIIAQTDRLVLRTEAPGDRDVWLAHMNTPEVLAYLGGPRTAEQVVRSFEQMAHERAEHGFSFLMVALRSDGTPIGRCGLARIEAQDAPEPLRGALQIGWTLRADYWGQGYAREAADATLAMAFEQHDAERVYGQTGERNEPSWRLMEKLGMTRRADLDYADPDYPPQDNPTMVYDLARADWRAKQKDPAR